MSNLRGPEERQTRQFLRLRNQYGREFRLRGVQRVLDGSTGRFKSGFSDASEDFVKALEEEKIITKATVNDAAVESLTADSAVVLVSATSRREGPEAPEDQKAPRQWRVVMTLEREDGQIKVSAVEFT